jgi:hypothetical protein
MQMPVSIIAVERSNGKIELSRSFLCISNFSNMPADVTLRNPLEKPEKELNCSRW